MGNVGKENGGVRIRSLSNMEAKATELDAVQGQLPSMSYMSCGCVDCVYGVDLWTLWGEIDGG